MKAPRVALGAVVALCALATFNTGASIPDKNRVLPGRTLSMALEYIQAHAGEDIRLQQLADAVP